MGWLKLSRLKKLMEDENYRVLILSKLATNIESKVSPDDHVQDLVSGLRPPNFNDLIQG